MATNTIYQSTNRGVDTVPTANSENLITSGGVKSAMTLSESGAFFKYGPFAGYMSNFWTAASDVTIPVGYRPRMMDGAIGNVRQGTTNSIDQIRFNTDGTITLPGGQTSFYGMFVWLT